MTVANVADAHGGIAWGVGLLTVEYPQLVSGRFPKVTNLSGW